MTPVYRGQLTLPALAEEIERLTQAQTSPDGHLWVVGEWLLVYDNGPDASAEVIAHLAETCPFVRPVWLSRNFGQHAATLAGMASSSGDWIATIDEDGQHDPAALGDFLDSAVRSKAGLVYALPTNHAPHGRMRNMLSRGLKWLFLRVLSDARDTAFHSFRLVLGETGRSVAAYAGAGVFLDVALGWVTNRIATVPVAMRDEGREATSYNFRRLLSHFWMLVLSSGTKGLRLVSVLGFMLAVLGLGYATYVVGASLVVRDLPPGWVTILVVVLIGSGTTLLSLGMVAEYVGVAVSMAMGRPPYLIASDPAAGPLGRPGGPPKPSEGT